jgi:glycosyltransferase involved in cell wall biosynthesis
MRLAIDASRSIDGYQKTGVEVVSDALLRAMAVSTPEGAQISYYTPSRISWIPVNQQRVVPGHRFWTILRFSLALWRDRPDALFVPVHAMPWWLPKTVVRVIHDVSFFRAPDAYSWRERTYMRLDLWRARRRCHRVIVPTEAVKDDLVGLAGFPPERVTVTGWGLNEPGHAVVPAKAGTQKVLPAPDGVAAPFVLFVSRVEEKKNVANLIRAFAEFRKTHPEWRLVLAGKPGHGYDRITPLLSEPGVEALGYISDDRKWQLLAEARMLAIVSKEEGFAFPMLEAFHAGVPVVASDIPVLREIGGEACVYAAPTDVAGIAAALSVAADDPALRERLVAAGTELLRHYEWETVAQKVWAAFRR